MVDLPDPIAAHTASEPPSVSELLERVSSKGKNIQDGGDKARKELLATARSLCLALETPIESILRMEWAEVSPLSQHSKGPLKPCSND